MRIVTVIVVTLVLAACGNETAPPATLSPAATAATDYLSAELRARVEELKTAVRNSPSDNSSVAERSRLVFDWINAYALSGGYIPVNATQTVLRIGGYGLPSPEEVDDLIAELALVDEEPQAIGPLALEPPGPFIAGSLATFTQIYTVGSRPVQTGGGFLVANHFNANNGQFQTADPAAANYLTVSSSNPAVSFTVAGFAVAGMHGGFRGAQDQLVFRVADGTLNTGDQVRITYGDTRGGGSGLEMPDFNSEAMPFPLYVDLDGSDLWLSIPIQPVPVVGSTIEQVTGFAPSIVAPGETVSLSVRAADGYGNRAQGAIPDWDIRDQQGNLLASIPSADSAVTVAELTFSQPGIQRLTMTASDGSLSGEFNPILVQENPVNRIYWGETHGHSGFSEGIGTADAYMLFARDEARLDFVTHSEHDMWMDDKEWELLRRMVQKYNEEGRFLAYLGYEWTIARTQGGHHNVLYRTPAGRQRMSAQLYPVLSSLYQGLREHNDTRDVLVIPHAHQKGDYRLTDPEMETLVEIMSGHGTFEWFARMYLNHGHMVGFVAASDDHIGKPGYSMPKSASMGQRGGLAAVFATEKTTDGIFDAMKALRTYATSGQRIIMDVDVNGSGMGQRARHRETRDINARIVGTAPIRSVTLFKNDHVLQEWSYNAVSGSELALSFYSESYPYHPDDNPRGWRHWRGSLEVSGATLQSARLMDLQNLSMQRVQQDPDNPNLVNFSTLTRGDHSTLLLTFDGPSDNASITLTLQPATETGSGPPQLRPHQRIAGQTVELSLAGSGSAVVTQDVGVDGYLDTISLSRQGEMPMEVELGHTDTLNPRQGDYYFFRVRQADEGLAWSSPVWVGGSPSR